MAWDAPRRSPEDGLPPHPSERHLLRVDEVKINNSQTLHTLDNKSDMGPMLSPIHEETRILAVDAPLQVTVTVRFRDPAIRSVYSRTYFSSQLFRPTERICRGLLRRIRHCSEELITRKDSDALNITQCLRKGPKQLRFELAFEIHRRGQSDLWGWCVFKSYQKHALTRASAKEVVRSTHSIVGMFLARHDKNFRLTDEPVHEHFPERPETFKPSPAGPLGLACVPRSRFVASTQTWEFVPGYSLELTFKSSNPARQHPEIRRALTVDSSQAAPLTLGFGEDLLWQAYRSLQDVLDQKKNVFDLEHASCDGSGGMPDCDCRYFDEDALQVELRVVNNLGPIYDHLSRSIQSRLRLFNHPTGQDCDDFIRRISAHLRQFRDSTDKKVENLNDFDFRVSELTGHGWQENNSARFIIDGKQNHSRRSIEALLDRIRTSVCDVLRGHDVAIRMVAYKRGHLILDKALIARDHRSTPPSDALGSSAAVKQAIVAELKTRIDRDISMICEDTCSLEDEPGETPTSPERTPPRIRLFTAPALLSTPRSCAPQSQWWSPPGSPGSFATRPPTPPHIPPRTTSIRVFPLVPARYKQNKERLTSESSSARDSAVGMGFESDYRALRGSVTSESVISLKIPAAIHESRHENAVQGFGDKVLGLRPAAEVYPALKAIDCETDSNSTHSSLPALTESDSPSPEPSMLVTPNFVRSASPSRRGAPFYEDSDLHHLPGPLMLNSSGPNSATFSEVERFADPKVMHPRPSVLDGQPVTPGRVADAEDLPLVDTPKASLDCGGDDKTPLAHRQMHGPTSTEVIRESGTEHSAARDSSVTSRSNSLHILPSETVGEPEMGCSGAVAESSMSGRGVLPTEGLLLRRREAEAQVDVRSAEDRGLVDADVNVAQCDSSETLRPMVSEQRFIDDVAGLRCDEILRAQSKAEIPHEQVTTTDEVDSDAVAQPATSNTRDSIPQESEVNTVFDEVEPSASSKEPDSVSPAATTDSTEAMSRQHEPVRIKPGFFEQEGDSTIGSEGLSYSSAGGDVTAPEAETQSMGMSENCETAGHVIPLSDSGVDIRAGSEVSLTAGPEVDERHLLSPVDEHNSKLDNLEPRSKTSSDLLVSVRETASEPSGKASDRPGDDLSADISNSSSDAEVEALEQTSPAPTAAPTAAPTPAPTPAPEALSFPNTGFSAPALRVSRSVSNPSPARLGLGNNSLLPALPIFSSFTSNDNVSITRDSWSSSSSWEDFVSTGRQSSDSVDTVKLSPQASEEEDGVDSPKRLGTPTAGLLGLHESRWAEFGLRTALTGTHAFDRPATALLSMGSRGEMRLVEPDNVNKCTSEKHASPSSPRKAFHLRHKTSAGSILAGRPHKKESGDLKNKKRKDPKKQDREAKSKVKQPVEESMATKVEDESAGRFPRAMMLVAGLAFASSVVSRNHA